MTKDEALQMCLEYIETDAHERRYVRWAINEALAQPAQEPVAYLCKPDQHGLFDPPTPDKACEDCFPVYATPPQPAQEPVACIEYIPCCIDQTCSKCKAITPPQRTWVGLTDGERLKAAGIDAADEWFWEVVEAIEAKLKEKNT